ncbi:MAG: polysaccharide pyruvyl transferase family protein [Bacteroidaceae bacterium]
MIINNYIKKFVYLSANTLYEWFFRRSTDVIALNSWLVSHKGRVMCRNFGDELNVHLLAKLTGKTIVDYNSYFHRPFTNYMVIGSIIDGFTDSKSVVWGSGLLSDKEPLKKKPAKVCAVRGKITRDFLLANGVECPEVYGDPALLTPYIYSPQVEKKYKIGVIPHIRDIDNPQIAEFVAKNSGEVHLIDFARYDDWHDVIDEICSCRHIVSSSLHGLILADAYKIPNLWISVSDKVKGIDCKFADYFSGVGREFVSPMSFGADNDVAELCRKMSGYVPLSYNPLKLVEACPFEIVPEIKKSFV